MMMMKYVTASCLVTTITNATTVMVASRLHHHVLTPSESL